MHTRYATNPRIRSSGLGLSGETVYLREWITPEAWTPSKGSSPALRHTTTSGVSTSYWLIHRGGVAIPRFSRRSPLRTPGLLILPLKFSFPTQQIVAFKSCTWRNIKFDLTNWNRHELNRRNIPITMPLR
jgi:hypothetical protein